MAQYDVLKGSTVVGNVTLSDPAADDPVNVLIIGSLVGLRACKQAHVSFDQVVDEYEVDWSRLDDDRVLDEQPWGLEPR